MKEKEDIQNDSMIHKKSEILVSYIGVVGYRDWSIFAERLLLRLVELTQQQIAGLNFRSGEDLRPLNPDYSFAQEEGSQYLRVSMPISDILPSREFKNYKYAFEAIKTLQRQVISWSEVQRDANGNVILGKDGNAKMKYVSVQVLGRVEMDANARGRMTMLVDKDIWKRMLDFSKGFRAIDLEVALRLHSKNSLRFYELMARQDRNLQFSVDELRSIFGTGDRYGRVFDFINRVIDPAKKELDSCSPYSFDYKINRANRSPKSRVVSITLIPIHQMQFDRITNIKGVDPVFVMLPDDVRTFLRKKLNFEWKEINNNIEVFNTAYVRMKENGLSLYDFLLKLHESILRNHVDNWQGYVINALKQHLKENYGITIKSEKQRRKEEKAKALMEKAADERREKKDDRSIPTIGTLFNLSE